MLKITKIDNLFQSPHRLTSDIIPIGILHPAIETKIIEEFGDSIKEAYIIGVFSKEINNFVPYTCITSPNGNMYRVEYIEVSKAYLSGYNVGNKGFDITVNPYHTSAPEHYEWIKGYHEGYKAATDTIPY
jgi:hypothetical protein